MVSCIDEMIRLMLYGEHLISAGYPTFRGQVLNGQQLWDLIEGLEANDLLYYTHLLTGI